MPPDAQHLIEVGGSPSWTYLARLVLADLRDLDPALGQTVTLGGRTITGDGGGGPWTWDPNDSTADVSADTGSVLTAAPNSDPTGRSGAWRRIVIDGIHAAWAGLTPGAADKTSALQDFLNALTHYNRHGYAPAGVYKHTGVTVSDAFRIQGEGIWRIVSGGNYDFYSCTTFAYDGAANGTSLTLSTDSARGLRIENVTFTEYQAGMETETVAPFASTLNATGLELRATAYPGIFDTSVPRNAFVGLGRGIYLNGNAIGADISIERTEGPGCVFNNCTVPIEVNSLNSYHTVFSTCWFEGTYNEYGVKVMRGTAELLERCYFHGDNANTPYYGDIYVQTGHVIVKNARSESPVGKFFVWDDYTGVTISEPSIIDGCELPQQSTLLNITAIADAGGGNINLSVANHGYYTADRVTITGTADYNGDYTATVVDANTLQVTAAYTSSQAGSVTNQRAFVNKSAGRLIVSKTYASQRGELANPNGLILISDSLLDLGITGNNLNQVELTNTRIPNRFVAHGTADDTPARYPYTVQALTADLQITSSNLRRFYDLSPSGSVRSLLLNTLATGLQGQGTVIIGVHNSGATYDLDVVDQIGGTTLTTLTPGTGCVLAGTYDGANTTWKLLA